MRGFPAAALVWFALVATACGGGSDAEDASEPVPTPVIGGIRESTPTPVPTAADGAAAVPSATAAPEPTAVPESALFDAAIGAYTLSPLPEDTVAFDMLDQRLREGGLVELTVCTWNGASVFDEVREVLVRVEPATLNAVIAGSAPTAGDCLASGIVETALDFVEEYLVAFHRVQTDPETIVSDNADLQRLTTQDLFLGQVELVDEWIGAQVRWRTTQYRPGLRDDLEGEILWRRYTGDDGPEFALAVCRPMVEGYGLYRNGALVDDEKGDDPGQWSAIEFRMRRTEDGSAWEMIRTDSRVWAHCFRSGDWPATVNEWKPEPAVWQVVP